MNYTGSVIQGLYVDRDTFNSTLKYNDLYLESIDKIETKHYTRLTNIGDFIMLNFYKSQEEKDKINILYDILRYKSILVSNEESTIPKDIMIKYSTNLDYLDKSVLYDYMITEFYKDKEPNREKYIDSIVIDRNKFTDNNSYIEEVNKQIAEHKDMIKGVVIGSKNIRTRISTDNLISNHELMGHSMPLELSNYLEKVQEVLSSIEDCSAFNRTKELTLYDVFHFTGLPIDCIKWVTKVISYKMILSERDEDYEFN